MVVVVDGTNALHGRTFTGSDKKRKNQNKNHPSVTKRQKNRNRAVVKKEIFFTVRLTIRVDPPPYGQPDHKKTVVLRSL